MRNTRRGEFRLTSALSARAVEIASEICRANHLLSGLRAREGRGEPLTRLALLKWASEIGGVTHTVWRRHDLAAAARGAARIGVTGPTRTSRRCAAASERLCAGCRRFPVGHGVSG